ncbi:MAG: 30S ribosomal protein S6 [Candidatus Syntrophonatronum acetioxidans]|uniref:Small ribosomal subunit protein bS6 n=1 Tax=Candidatus Syntrophonatronum acetioxidans TaxID=1795816 RepID=A0A424YFT4_9FIRM|nr:MAG: 30S ribosomal protein S6 [Candidatus Syntrophonatronum acetioxidans]
MKNYEAMVVLHPQYEDEQVDQFIEKVQETITKDGGEVTNLDKWGKKKLAYEINKLREGHYVVMNYTAPHETSSKMEKAFKIADGVLRYLIVLDEK